MLDGREVHSYKIFPSLHAQENTLEKTRHEPT